MQERVRDIRHARRLCPKPTLEECVAILDEAAALPPPEQAPGGADVCLSLEVQFRAPDVVVVSWRSMRRLGCLRYCYCPGGVLSHLSLVFFKMVGIHTQRHVVLCDVGGRCLSTASGAHTYA